MKEGTTSMFCCFSVLGLQFSGLRLHAATTTVVLEEAHLAPERLSGPAQWEYNPHSVLAGLQIEAEAIILFYEFEQRIGGAHRVSLLPSSRAGEGPETVGEGAWLAFFCRYPLVFPAIFSQSVCSPTPGLVWPLGGGWGPAPRGVAAPAQLSLTPPSRSPAVLEAFHEPIL